MRVIRRCVIPANRHTNEARKEQWIYFDLDEVAVVLPVDDEHPFYFGAVPNEEGAIAPTCYEPVCLVAMRSGATFRIFGKADDLGCLLMDHSERKLSGLRREGDQ